MVQVKCLAPRGGDGCGMGCRQSLHHLLHLCLNLVHRSSTAHHGSSVSGSRLYNGSQVFKYCLPNVHCQSYHYHFTAVAVNQMSVLNLKVTCMSIATNCFQRFDKIFSDIFSRICEPASRKRSIPALILFFEDEYQLIRFLFELDFTKKLKISEGSPTSHKLLIRLFSART